MVKRISIDFTYSKRDEFSTNRNQNTIYKDGTFLGNPSTSSSILIEGGDDLFQHQKLQQESSAFYITNGQIRALYSLFKSISVQTDQLQIDGENEQLKSLCYAIFRNING